MGKNSLFQESSDERHPGEFGFCRAGLKRKAAIFRAAI
jgi:hypothetical protein